MTRADPLARSARAVLTPANEPQGRQPVRVEIVAPDAARDSGVGQAFWALVGDLAADLLLEGTEGPWTQPVGSREMMTP